MSLFATPDEHAANPPATWAVERVADHHWRLCTRDGVELGRYTTKSAAEQDRTSGPFVRLYDKETRWYAGEPVAGWRPYRELAKNS